jgi:quinol monooxygenase YgiN
MIVVRFKIRCQPGKAEHALAVMEPVVAPSRALNGVISFDIGRDITDPNTVVATEVFESRAALDQQESLPEIAKVMDLLPQLLAEPPDATIFHVSSCEPYE